MVTKPHDSIVLTDLTAFQILISAFPFDLSTIWNGFPMDDAAPVGARSHTGLGVCGFL